jgi:hypothetical protein
MNVTMRCVVTGPYSLGMVFVLGEWGLWCNPLTAKCLHGTDCLKCQGCCGVHTAKHKIPQYYLRLFPKDHRHTQCESLLFSLHLTRDSIRLQKWSSECKHWANLLSSGNLTSVHCTNIFSLWHKMNNNILTLCNGVQNGLIPSGLLIGFSLHFSHSHPCYMRCPHHVSRIYQSNTQNAKMLYLQLYEKVITCVIKITVILSQNISLLWTCKSRGEAKKISPVQRNTKHSPWFVSEQEITSSPLCSATLGTPIARGCIILCNLTSRSSHKKF